MDSALWPYAGILVVIAVALLARWLRNDAVEDLGKGSAGDEGGDGVAGEESEGGFGDAVAAAELDLEAYDDEDDVAPLGSSADDRLDFLERLAERGAIALVWSPPPEPGQPPTHSVVQVDHADGAATLPVFTSERKAFASLQALGPEPVANVHWYETMQVDVAFLVQGEFEVVVNPFSPFETALSEQDRDTLAALAGVEEREPYEAAAELDADDDTAPSET